jgi:hypothetical protein
MREERLYFQLNIENTRQTTSQPMRRITSKDVYAWIEQAGGETDSNTGEAFCSYAKATVKTKTIQVVPGEFNLIHQINHCGSIFDALALQCVILYIQYKITESKLKQQCAQAQTLNPNYSIHYQYPHQDRPHVFQKAPLIFIKPH